MGECSSPAVPRAPKRTCRPQRGRRSTTRTVRAAIAGKAPMTRASRVPSSPRRSSRMGACWSRAGIPTVERPRSRKSPIPHRAPGRPPGRYPTRAATMSPRSSPMAPSWSPRARRACSSTLCRARATTRRPVPGPGWGGADASSRRRPPNCSMARSSSPGESLQLSWVLHGRRVRAVSVRFDRSDRIPRALLLTRRSHGHGAARRACADRQCRRALRSRQPHLDADQEAGGTPIPSHGAALR